MPCLPIEDTIKTCEAMAFSHLPRDGPFLFGFTTGDDMPSRDPASGSQRAPRAAPICTGSCLRSGGSWKPRWMDSRGWSYTAKTLCNLSGGFAVFLPSAYVKLMCRLLVSQDTNFATPTSRFSMTRLFDVTAKFAELLGRAHVEERRLATGQYSLGEVPPNVGQELAFQRRSAGGHAVDGPGCSYTQRTPGAETQRDVTSVAGMRSSTRALCHDRT